MQEENDKQGLMAIGELIAKRREVNRMKQEELAERLQVPRGVIGKFETGQQEIFLDQLLDIAGILKSHLSRFIPEPSTIGTGKTRPIGSKALFPEQEKLVSLLSGHYPLKEEISQEENYLRVRELKSKRKRSSQ